MRGTRLNAAERRYGIKKGGLIVYPEPTLNVENLAPGEKRESSGIVEFDKMLGGGFLETQLDGDCLEPQVTGKTSVALHFLKEGHNRGEKSVYISYEETPEQLTRHASGFGWTLQPSVDKGGLKLLSFDVEQLNLDDHLFELCTMLESFKPARLVVDSIDPVKRMLSEDYFIRFVKNLITVTRRVGTTVMLTAFAKPTDVWVAGPDVSSVVDNMISLRDVEISSVLKRSLVVFKERGTKHDRGIREFEITNRGVIIKEKFKGVEQVLTGLPRRALTPTSSTHFCLHILRRVMLSLPASLK